MKFKKNAVIFDLDGVINTITGHGKPWQTVWGFILMKRLMTVCVG